MRRLTFLELAEKVIREEQRPLSPAEIWKIAKTKGHDAALSTQGKTPAGSLYSVVFRDSRDNPATIFVKVGHRPARYFLKELAGETKQKDLERATSVPDDVAAEAFQYAEADLHPFLSYYASVFFSAHTKTIRHAKSRKKQFGEWVHPDMIGVHYALGDWCGEVIDLGEAVGNTPVKLYSFEIKKSLSFPNLREAFFQAVSNSSWANVGYLVAADVSLDEDFLGELRRLCASFGIGVISLSLEDPDSSEVVFPARDKDTLDWDTLSKLAAMNKDVRDLVTRIRNDVRSKEIIKEKYDPIPDAADLLRNIKKRKPKGVG